MGLFLGLMANRPDCLRAALERHGALFERASASKMSAWGLAFYQGGEVLHKKQPFPRDEPFQWQAFLGNLASECVVLHGRQATVGTFRLENTHPFRFRSWTMAHVGTLANFAARRPALAESLPDFLRRNMRGDTDSELLFHLFLAELHEVGQLEAMDAPQQAVVESLRRVVEKIGAMDRDEAQSSVLSCVLTNGRQMYALARGTSLYFRSHRASASETAADSDPSLCRYVLLYTDLGGSEGLRDFESVEEGQVLLIDRSLETHLLPLSR